jgi:hypothetical protein
VELNEKLAEIVQQQNQRLAGDLGNQMATPRLSPGEYEAAMGAPARAYGTALERMVEAAIRSQPSLAPYLKYVSQPGRENPDWVGQGPLEGLMFDLTTEAGAAKHYLRSYGENLVVHTYTRPFGVGF